LPALYEQAHGNIKVPGSADANSHLEDHEQWPEEPEEVMR
jgi:hypothetical protein